MLVCGPPAGGGQRAANAAGCGALEERVPTNAPRARRRRARAVERAAPRAVADGIDIVEVQQEGDGRAVRAALEALRAKRREREMVGFYSSGPRSPSQPAAGAPGVQGALAELRARHQQDMVQLRTRLNGRLSKASAYARHCDRAIRNRDATVASLHEELLRFQSELATIARLAADSAADPKQASFKFVTLAERAKALQTSVDASIAHVNQQRVRQVDVMWSGMAEDVRIMGSFDGWTWGVPLSPEEPQAFTTFSATLQLLPGTYEIKLLVDGGWRLAADWPQTGEGLAANNVLVVGEDCDELTLTADALTAPEAPGVGGDGPA